MLFNTEIGRFFNGSFYNWDRHRWEQTIVMSTITHKVESINLEQAETDLRKMLGDGWREEFFEGVMDEENDLDDYYDI